MEILDKIVKCEHSYSELTSNVDDKNSFIRYMDNVTPEMPLQNYIYIKRNTGVDDMRRIVTAEKEIFHNNKSHALRFVFDPYIPFSGEIPELSEFIFSTHCILILDLKNLETNFADPNCFPVLTEHKEKLRTLYQELNCSINAAERHVSRWIDIKFSNKNLQTVVYSDGGLFLGNCELYFNEDIVKLDDLEVLKHHRNRRVGDALLRSAISITKSKNFNTLYLIADKNEWVVDYYQRRGFELYAEYNSCTLYG